LLFSFKFSHFFNFRACKNDFFLFIMGTSSLEARNIRFVNSNLSRVQEAKHYIFHVSSSDNKSVSHWIMFDYFFHV
jgi:hypothetical protein